MNETFLAESPAWSGLFAVGAVLAPATISQRRKLTQNILPYPAAYRILGV
ncbi:hypothetical protein ACLEIY_10485 [Acetobacter tropicalis]|nr:hypothetical protein [Acetobacter senegalensis]